MTDYSTCSVEDFDKILSKIVDELPGSTLLTIPGIYEILSEYFNNDVLEEWKNKQLEHNQEE
jgi:hypothetical protein